MPANRLTPPSVAPLMIDGPLQPQLFLLLDTLAKDPDERSLEERRSLARRIHAALGQGADECLEQLNANLSEEDRSLLLVLADRHEQRTPAAPAADPRERLRRLEPARRYRDAAQVLAMLAVLAGHG